MNSNAKHTRGLGAWTCISVVTAALLMASSSFAQFSVSQSGGISVIDNAIAAPYPSTVWVTNVLGTLEKATITLYGVAHGYANDLSVLLVGPDGKSVVLMSDAGGGVPIDNAAITFDDGASDLLPHYWAIQSGSYKPADYGKALFPAPAPAGPYGQKLAAVAGGDPNGTWSLYALDDLPLSSGAIASWTLNLHTTPIITLATNKVYVDQNESVTLNLTVQDSSTLASAITVTAVSGDQTVITNTGLVVTGSDQNRTVTITPNVNKHGTVPITVKASDGIGEAQPKTFEVIIKHINQPPVVTLTNDIVATVAGVLTSNLFAKVDDIDTAIADLKLSATSSNPDVVAPAGVFFSGSGPWRTFSIVPSGAAIGRATVTILVTDGSLTNSSKIDVVVAPALQPVFGNPAAFTLSSSGTAISTISVSSLQSYRVGKVTVSLDGLDKVVGGQMSVVLETPENVQTKLFDRSGPSAPVSYAQVTFDDAASGTQLPLADAITNTPLHPSEHLSKLIGVKPNGTWTLYVTNGATGSGSAILGGWVLNVYAAPFVSSIPDQRMSEVGTKAVNYTVFDLNGKVTNVTATIPDNPGLAQLDTILTGTNVTTTITGKFNASGTNLVQVVAQDDNGFRGTNTFTLAVEAVNNPPILSFIEKQITRAGEPIGPIAFKVTDVDNPIAAVTVTATSDNGQILPNANILLQGSGEDRSVTLFPVGVQSGTAVVTITADDGKAKSTSSFLLYVQEAGNPLFAAKGLITINANAKATPYPSTNVVSGLVGAVAEVEVTLNNMTIASPGDVGVLLVSPDGRKVVLMGKVGGANPILNSTLVFSDSAAGPLPNTQSAVSGIYKPTQVTTPTFPDGPAAPYSTSMSAFAGGNPNGAWSLWVYDDKAGKEGYIAGGWLLSIRTTPKIAEIGTQKTQRNVPKRVTVVVGDSQPGVNFTVTATPDNSDLVQTPIQISGSGGTRTLLISPVLYKWGETTIRVSASDGQSTSVASFLFQVEYVDLPPVVSAIPNQNTPKASLIGPISFKVWDPQDNDPNGFTISASSSDTLLVPNENIKINWNKMDGSGTNTWSIFILPAGVRTGSATISVSVIDKVGQKSNTSFVLTVSDAPAFANETAIDIPEGLPMEGTATPYPSVISVARVGGLVSNVRVALVGLSHLYPADVNVLVVSPDNSKAVMLMARAGGWYPADDLRIMFSDSASEMLPESDALSEGTFLPSFYGDKKVSLPAPAPPGPYADKLAAFSGLSPNGDWKLYVLDDTFPDGGVIAAGWILYLETGPAITPIAAQTTQENQAIEVPIFLSSVSANLSNIIVTATSSGNYPDNLVVPAGLVVSGYGGTRTLKITPTKNLPSAVFLSTNAPGTNLITVWAADPNLKVTNSISFPLTVAYVNQTPVVTSATNSVWMDENATLTVQVRLGDVDSDLWATNLTVTSSVPELVPNDYKNNIKFTAENLKPGTTGTMNIQITPLANKYGSTVIQVATTDGITPFSYNLTLNVRHIYQQPTISSIANQSVPAGSWTTNIQFTVNSVEVDPKLLTVTATSSRQDLVPDRLIVLGGSGKDRTIQLTSLGTAMGSTLITVKVSDAVTNNATSFWLNLDPPQPGMFANSQAVTISGAAVATPYPSFITVNGMQGDVFKVTVLIDGLTHTAPVNGDLLLVSPDGKAVMLMSGAGGSSAVSGVRLIFDDAAEGQVPVDQLASGIYRPSSNTKVALPPPAPTNGYLATMSGFAGSSPNGQWKLYFNNRGAGDSGRILGGWSLKIQTAPTIVLNTTSPSPLIIDENQKGLVYFTIGDMVAATKDLVVIAGSDNPLLLPARGVAFTQQGGGNMLATLTPEPYQSGTNNLTLTVYRSDGARDSIVIPMFVRAQNALPTFSRLNPQATPENTPIDVEFLVQDPDTPLANLILKVESSNQLVIGNTNLLFFGKTNYWAGLPESDVAQTSLVSLTLRPNADVSGDANIKITVVDPMPPTTNTVTSQFKLSVQKVYYPPVISQVSEQRVPAGGTTLPIGFQVYTRNTPAPTITVSATSSDEKFVKKAKIVIAPVSGVNITNRTVTITAEDSAITAPTPVSITLTASDGERNSSMSFNLVILPRPERYYSNTTPIVIADNAAGNPYPSTVNVNDLVGRISKLSVTLNGFTHTFPSDVGILLVGPGGQKSVLMNRAGDGGGVQSAGNLSIKFDQGAANPIPSGPLTSGSYRPADYKQGLYNFLSPAPAGPYTASLTNFTGSPVGTWSLYVLDDTPGDSGMISNGWTLAVTTEPTITGLAAMQISENQTARQSFAIADDAPAPEPYTIWAQSSNTGVLPDKNITFSGSGKNWTVTVAPATNKFGTNISVTIFASNSYGQTTASSFRVDVVPQLSPPVINQVADQQIPAGTVALVNLVYSDAHTPHDQLVVGVESSNLVLVPQSSLKISGNTLRIEPVGDLSGKSQITVSVRNGYGLTTQMSFILTVTPNPMLFANTNSIVIGDNSRATPYPSTLAVSGVNGDVVALTVNLAGFAHSFPSDVSVLLVGPQGQKVVILSRAGGGVPVSNVRLTFDDAADAMLPQYGVITDGAYRPTDYKASDSFFTPAPPGIYSKTLSAFVGTNPNGTWSLYVQDDASPDSGSITGGWSLNFSTRAPNISYIPPQTVSENSTITVPFVVSSPVSSADRLIASASSSGENPAGLILAGNLIVSGTGSSRTLTITPAANMPSMVSSADGTATIMITVTDGSYTNTSSFPLTVKYVNQAPAIAGLADSTTPANVPLVVNFTISDVDTPIASLVTTATNSPPDLGTVVLSGTGANRTLTFTPKGTAGQAVINVVVSDGNSTTVNTFTVGITSGIMAEVTSIGNREIPENGMLTVEFNVGNADPALVRVTADTDNPGLVQEVLVQGIGASRTATIKLVPYANSETVGPATITITAVDGKIGTGSESFMLTVTPVDFPPVLDIVPNQAVLPNAQLRVPISVSDPDTALEALTFKAASSNEELVSDIRFETSGSSVVAVFTPAKDAQGTAVVTVSAADAATTRSVRFNLSVTPNAGPRLALAREGQQWMVRISGAPNATYTIQSTGDLKTWSDAGTVTTDEKGAAEFRMSSSQAVNSQFYRALAR